MNIQTKIKVLALILFLFSLACSFDLPLDSGSQNQSHHFYLQNEPSQKIQLQTTKRALQAVAVSPNTGAVINPINNTRFQGLTIYHEIPINWVIGQVFQVRGRLNSQTMSDSTYVVFTFISTNSALTYTFRTTVPTASSEFTLTVNTKAMQPGDYYLAFYPGLSGSYQRSTVYSVRYPGSENVYAMPPHSPSGCSLNFQNNRLILRWKQDGLTPLERVAFMQGFNTVEYVLSNFHSQFSVPFKDFAAFTNGFVTVTVASAYSSQNSAGGRISSFSPFPWSFVFRAGQHSFIEEPILLDLSIPLPERVPLGTTVRIQGTTYTTTYNEAVIEEPQNVITKLRLINNENKLINAGSFFDTSMVLNNEGIFIFEIIGSFGEALVLRPIYVGDFYPLLPDFVDMEPERTNAQIIAAQPQGIDNLRTQLLSLINQKRQEWGRAALSSDSILDNLAYRHSYDMMTRNFFGHLNPDGDRAQQRATKAGLYYPVSENVGKGLDLAQIHFRLTKSPGHLVNIVNQNSTRVGLGIVRASDGYLYLTQNYAGPLPGALPNPSYQNPTPSYQNPTPTYQNPTPTPSASSQTQLIQTNTGSSISASQIESLRLQIRDWIQNAYPTSVQDPVLSTIVKNWLNSGMSESIFDYTWDINNYSTTGLSASSVNGPYDLAITNYFMIGSHLAQPDSSYTKFGVGILLYPDNMLRIQVEYAQ